MLTGVTLPQHFNTVLCHEQGIELRFELLIRFKGIIVGGGLYNYRFILNDLIFKLLKVMPMSATDRGLVIDRSRFMDSITKEAFKDMKGICLIGDMCLRYSIVCLITTRGDPVGLDGNLYWLREPDFDLPEPGQLQEIISMGQPAFQDLGCSGDGVGSGVTEE
ncbi:MAG: hypothetical protein NT096_00185 [Proteobacteria bacterium]|nr:hypothetical protein [Pseudomonadota bacterium]